MSTMPFVGTAAVGPSPTRPSEEKTRVPYETANITVLEQLPEPKSMTPVEPPQVSFVEKCKSAWSKRKKVIIALIVIVSIAVIAIAIAIKVAISKKQAAKRKKAKRKRSGDGDEDELEEEEKMIQGTRIGMDESVSTLRKIEEGVGSIKRMIKGTPIR